MSAIFRDEIRRLMSMVARAAREASEAEGKTEHVRARVEARVNRLKTVSGRMAKQNRAAVVECLKAHARPHAPISANKVGEICGLKDDTARKYLTEMADSGMAVAVPTPSGSRVRYYWSNAQ